MKLNIIIRVGLHRHHFGPVLWIVGPEGSYSSEDGSIKSLDLSACPRGISSCEELPDSKFGANCF